MSIENLITISAFIMLGCVIIFFIIFARHAFESGLISAIGKLFDLWISEKTHQKHDISNWQTATLEGDCINFAEHVIPKKLLSAFNIHDGRAVFRLIATGRDVFDYPQYRTATLQLGLNIWRVQRELNCQPRAILLISLYADITSQHHVSTFRDTVVDPELEMHEIRQDFLVFQ